MESYIRYLSVKKAVDDRSLNRRVWERLGRALRTRRGGRPVRIVELGGGIGTMLERMVERRLCRSMVYRLVEREPAFVATFLERLPRRCRRRGWRLSPGKDGGLRVFGEGVAADVSVACADLREVVASPEERGRWDVVMAHGVMDLVDIGSVLPGCAGLTGPGGLLFLTLNYDGRTGWTPSWPDDFEEELLERYHLTMDRRTAGGDPSGTRRSGHRLLEVAHRLGLERLAAGSSDWLVRPAGGRYRDGEEAFLEAILDTISGALDRDPALDPRRFALWLELRREALRAGRLGFAARNLDVLFRVPGKAAGAERSPDRPSAGGL